MCVVSRSHLSTAIVQLHLESKEEEVQLSTVQSNREIADTHPLLN